MEVSFLKKKNDSGERVSYRLSYQLQKTCFFLCVFFIVVVVLFCFNQKCIDLFVLVLQTDMCCGYSPESPL